MRWLRFGLWMLALTPALWLAVQFRGLPNLGKLHDDGLYIVAAKAIAEGQGSRILSLPGQPLQTKYPPLFSAWLAPVWKLNSHFPENRGWFLPLVWIWLPALALLSRVVFRDFGFSERWCWVLSAAILLNPVAAYFSVNVMSELMMMTLVVASLALAERGRGISSGALTGAAFLVRTAALPALLAVPIVFCIRKQFRQALYFSIIAGSVGLGWFLWAGINRSPEWAGDYYTDYVGLYLVNHGVEYLPLEIARNVPLVILSAGQLLMFTTRDIPLVNYFGTLLGLLSLLGLFRLGPFTHYHAFVAASLVMLVAWNYPPNERFLLPTLPFLCAGLAGEILRAAKLSKWSKLLAVPIVVPILWANSEALFKIIPAMAKEAWEKEARMLPVYQWIAASTPPDARFIADLDPLVYLYAGRTGRATHFQPRFFYRDQWRAGVDDVNALSAFARRHALDWALILPDDQSGTLSSEELRQRVQQVASDPRLELVHCVGAARIFRIHQEAPSTLVERDADAIRQSCGYR